MLEVGAGLGALTLALLEQGAGVLAVERDAGVARALGWVLTQWCRPPVLGTRVWLVVADVLSLAMDLLLGGARLQAVAANLPYGITSPFLMQLVRARGWQQAVLMVQQEVAERLAARPGSSAYGSLSVAVQAHARVEVLFGVSRRCFYPAPEVDSAVVALQASPGRPGPALAWALEEVLRASFGQRRKVIRNALASLVGRPQAGGEGPDAVQQLLQAASVDGGRRAEELPVESFLRLASAWAAFSPLSRPAGAGASPSPAAPAR